MRRARPCIILMALCAVVGLGASAQPATTPGTIDQFHRPGRMYPERITAGPDGNVWFSDFAKDYIGRVTPDGTIKVFRLGSQIQTPDTLAIGPEGNIWFTDPNGGKVAFITTKGVLTVLPNVFVSPTGIAAGPDGNIWVTEEDAQAVERIAPTPPYAMTTFPVPGT